MQTLADGSYASGEHHIAWDTTGPPAGSYVVRMETASGASSAKVMLWQ